MESQRTLGMAGVRQAYIVSWRTGRGKSQMEAFATEEGAAEFVKRNGLKARIYQGIVMEGIYPSDAERGILANVVALREMAADGDEGADE